MMMRVALLTILLWPLTRTAPATERPENGTLLENGEEAPKELWAQVWRIKGRPDSLRPSFCGAPCERLFNARRAANATACRCVCPEEMPVFLQGLGQCIQRIEACPRPVRFEGAHIPIVSQPVKGQAVDFGMKILYKESSIKLKMGHGARCNVTSVEYLGRERSWLELGSTLIKPGWKNGAVFEWNAEPERTRLLGGALLLVRLNCAGNQPNAHCMTFRMNGTLESAALVDEPSESSRLETVVIILLVILLLLTVFGSAVLWNVCWRMKKSELITGLQLQFLYHLKQEQDAAADHYQALAAVAHQAALSQTVAAAHAADSNNNAGSNNEDTASPHLLAKRKLYFSPEFFEPHYMHNPPPMAQQFVDDLRRMIALAKHRMNQRKHVPNLWPIAEEPLEEYEPYMRHSARQQQHENAAEDCSPRSVKSVDSGHDSLNDSSSSTEELAERRTPPPPLPPPRRSAPSTPPERPPPAVPHPTPTSTNPTSSTNAPPQSRIPVNKLKGVRSPRLAPRLSIQSSSIDFDTPPVPATPPPPPPAKFAHLPAPSPAAERRRASGSYAVFPAEASALKKSLPRKKRSKARDCAESRRPLETEM